MITHPAIPKNEIERLLTLSALDLNYADLNDSLADLTRLAAGIAGTSVSLVNLVDAYTQWSIASHGFPAGQMPREDSVCQYTILAEEYFEVRNLSLDNRFKYKNYVTEDKLIYYFGVPLKTEEGQNIGALCVLDKNTKLLDPGKLAMLKIIAKEIVVLLRSKKIIEDLKGKLADITETQNKLAHDIRGPIAGIIGLARLFKNRVYDTKTEKLQEVFGMIENGGESIVSLAEDIMNNNKIAYQESTTRQNQYSLPMFREAIEKLYRPMAQSKNIHFEVTTGPENNHIFFPKQMLMQITGNLISNAMKFTQPAGTVSVELKFEMNETDDILRICVQDSGIGIERTVIDDILYGTPLSTQGTSGENGYGLGLCLVKRLVDSLDGTMEIFSRIGKGTKFEIGLPQKSDNHQMTSFEPAFRLAVNQQ